MQSTHNQRRIVPYISLEDKKRLAPAWTLPHTPGELNYLITILCQDYMGVKAAIPNYAIFNEVIGVLECAKQEFYRRMVVPYEEGKIEQNGDVYGD